MLAGRGGPETGLPAEVAAKWLPSLGAVTRRGITQVTCTWAGVQTNRPAERGGLKGGGCPWDAFRHAFLFTNSN